MKIGIIIPAAGASTRYSEAGGLRPKLDEDLGGRPVIQRTVELFTKRPEVGAIVVAGPAGDDDFAEFAERHADRMALLGAVLCRGGVETRTQTVRNALAHIPDDCTHIGVHDGARPAPSEQLLDRVFTAAQTHDAVIPGVPVADTLKRVEDMTDAQADIDPLDAILGGAGKVEGAAQVVVDTVSREGLVGVQTPQVFEASLLRRAYEEDRAGMTDDAQMVEAVGGRVVVVAGEARNIKITTPEDLALVRAILGTKGPSERPAHKRF
ncbi:MAG: 2-C-methyl-D-erythritol 4-phosphate cytidylyltransferase [Phycisphaerales bacterium]